MTTTCIARGINGACFQPDASPADEKIAISASVGAGGVNQSDDVRVIQGALNDVPADEGGPATPLNLDGISGPLTTKAIGDFQRIKLGFSDSRVDPNGPTLRALNAQRGSSVAAVSKVGAGRGPAKPRKNGQSGLLPNPFIVPLIESLVPDIRAAIRAASFQLTVVQPFVSTRKQQLPKGPFLENVRFSLKLLDSIFSFFKFANPLPVHQRLRAAFLNMDVALRRSFDTAPLIAKPLFRANILDSLEDDASAYTGMGGAFDGPQVKLEGPGNLPANQIYLCSNLAGRNRRDQILTVIHELAHFVSRENDPNDDHANGDFFDPGDKPRMDALPPRLKIRNAEHYAGYAFVCAFRQLV